MCFDGAELESVAAIRLEVARILPERINLKIPWLRCLTVETPKSPLCTRATVAPRTPLSADRRISCDAFFHEFPVSQNGEAQ